MSKEEKFVLYLLASINFTHIMDAMIMMPLGDIFMTLFGINPTQFSLLVSSYATGAFISSLFGIFLLDRFDRRSALIFIYSGFTLGTLLCGLSSSYEMLLTVRFTTGLFGGMIGATVLSVVSDIFPFKRRGRAMGIIMAAFSAAAALGVPFGLLLADQFSWKMPFFFVGGLGVLISTALLFRFPSMRDHLQEVGRKTVRQVISAVTTDRNQINALVLGFFLVLGHFLIIPFIAPYMTRNVGFTQGQITYIYLFGGFMTVFSSPWFGKLTDKYGALRVFHYLMVISFLPVVLITNMPPVAIPIALIATTLFFVFGSGRMIPPQTMITAAVGPDNRGSFMSVKSALQQLSIAIAAGGSGIIVSFDAAGQLRGYPLVGIISIVVCIVAMYLATKLKVAEGN